MSKSIEDLIEEAKPYLTKAVKYDLGKRPKDATDNYVNGCAKLLAAMRLMDEADVRRDDLKIKLESYMDRAEDLKPKKEIKVQKLNQYRIEADSTGHGYATVFGKCIDDKLTRVHVKDAYIAAHHQMINFVRFCELLVSGASSLRQIALTTGKEGQQNGENFKQLEQSLNKRGILLKIVYSETIHDREIVFDNGWVVKIGRGLDYFKRVDRFALGGFDQNLRPCHETTIDIMRIEK